MTRCVRLWLEISSSYHELGRLQSSPWSAKGLFLIYFFKKFFLIPAQQIVTDACMKGSDCFLFFLFLSFFFSFFFGKTLSKRKIKLKPPRGSFWRKGNEKKLIKERKKEEKIEAWLKWVGKNEDRRKSQLDHRSSPKAHISGIAEIDGFPA